MPRIKPSTWVQPSRQTHHVTQSVRHPRQQHRRRRRRRARDRRRPSHLRPQPRHQPQSARPTANLLPTQGRLRSPQGSPARKPSLRQQLHRRAPVRNALRRNRTPTSAPPHSRTRPTPSSEASRQTVRPRTLCMSRSSRIHSPSAGFPHAGVSPYGCHCSDGGPMNGTSEHFAASNSQCGGTIG